MFGKMMASAQGPKSPLLHVCCRGAVLSGNDDEGDDDSDDDMIIVMILLFFIFIFIFK